MGRYPFRSERSGVKIGQLRHGGVHVGRHQVGVDMAGADDQEEFFIVRIMDVSWISSA